MGGRTAPLSASLSSGAESLYHNVFLPSSAGIRLVCRSRAMNNAAVDFLCVSRCVHINFCSLVISFFVQWYVIRGGFAGSWVMNMVFFFFFCKIKPHYFSLPKCLEQAIFNNPIVTYLLTNVKIVKTISIFLF